MKLLSLVRLFCVLAMLAFAAQPALAKGPLAQIVISGPGLAEAVTVNDQHFLEALGLGMLEDFSEEPLATTPTAVGTGYELVRYIQNQYGNLIAFDRLTYYPNPLGAHAYIFYNGIEENGWSDYDGKWFYATPEGQAAMRDLLKALGTKISFAKEEHKNSTNVIQIIIAPSSPETYQSPFKNSWRYTSCSAMQCWRVE
jgi:hypothetical protein